MRFIDDACGRYILKANRKELEEHYNLATVPKDLRPNYNVAPEQILPVVTTNEDGKMKMEMMKWGIVAPWKPSLRLINTRDDKIFRSNLWKGLVSKKRALIPANGYYEWKPNKPKEPKTPYFFHPKQQDLFSFAGIWSSWKDVEGVEFKTYSIITTSPNKEAGTVHDRMPVILHQSEEADWLEPSKVSQEDLEPYLHPYEDGGLEKFEVSRDVNVAKNNNEKLVLPINSQ